MPGSILLDDYADQIKRQLLDHVSGLQIIPDQPQPQAPPPMVQPQPDQQNILQQLQGHVDNVLQFGQQQAQPVVQQVQQAPQNVLQVLNDHVDQVISSGPQPQPPEPQVPQQTTAQARAADLGYTPPEFQPGDDRTQVAPPHAPSTPDQTTVDQTPGNVANATGQVFPLSIRPSNQPTATYHSQGGSDLMAPRGTPVLNMQTGKVVEVYQDRGDHQVGGNAVLVHGDDGLDYYYAHFDQPSTVKPGDVVQAGQQIGAVGNSGNAWKGGTGETHLHIGIGHGISNGVGSEGGLGQNFNAQSLLSTLEEGVGQGKAAVGSAVQGARNAVTRTTAELSGGGSSGGVTDRAQQILGGAAQSASWLGDQGQKVVQAVLQTEGGLNNARGDSGKSAGPLQFYEEGQLANFARQMGLTLDQAKTYAEQHPLEAVQWAIGTPDKPGYLGAAIRAGMDRGLSGADLATYAQRTGQVSVSPERAGQNYNALFGQGQDVLGSTAGGPVSPLSPVTAPLNAGGQRQPARQPLVMGGNQAELPNVPTGLQIIQDAAGDAVRRAQQTGQDVSTAVQNAVAGAYGAISSTIGQTASDIGRGAQQTSQDIQAVGRTIAPNLGLDDVELGRRRAALEDNPAMQQRGAELAGQYQPLPPEQYTPGAVGSLATNVIAGQPFGQVQSQAQKQAAVEESQRQVREINPARDVPVVGGLSTGLTDMIIQNPLLFMPGAPMGTAFNRVGGSIIESIAPRLGGAASRITAEAINGAVQNAVFEMGAKDATPESVGTQFLAGLGFGGALGGLGEAAAPIGRRLIQEAPRLAELARTRQRGEADVNAALGGIPEAVARARGETPAAPETTRMYHGTGAAFESPEPGRFAEGGLFGPGYYLTDEPRVAGGVVAGERVAPARDVQEAIAQFRETGMPGGGVEPGAVLRPGYAQQADRGGYALRADLQDVTSRLNQSGLSERMRGMLEDRQTSLLRQIAEATPEAGPNVRAVDVPRELNLLNVDAPATSRDSAMARRAVVDAGGNAAEFDRGLASVQAILDRRGETLTKDHLYSQIVSATGNRASANAALHQAGFDGITYQGGRRVPIADEAGRPIEHTATVIFRESLPKIRNAVSGTQGGQVRVPFATNIAGAVGGGAVGAATAPENATPEERLARIGAGAAAGLAGTHALTRTLEGDLRLPDRGALADALRTRQRAEGINPFNPPPRPPRSLSEVQTNRYALREARPGETPMTDDELATHYDTLDQRLQQVENRFNAVDELIKNPGQKVERPPWAAGYTNDQVAAMARTVDRSPFEPLWWEKAGLESGSGEVRELLREGQLGFQAERGQGQRDLTPAELRRERNDLARERRDILATGDQLANAPPGTQFVRAVSERPADLPMEGPPTPPVREGPVGTTDIPAPEARGPTGAGGGVDEGARLAQEIVTNKGRLRGDEAQVIGEAEGITGRGILAPDEVMASSKPMTEQTKQLMPNLKAYLGEDMPEVEAQIQKAVEDNPELFGAYRQGRITFDSLKNDLAKRVGMDVTAWKHTKVGQAFNDQEMVALQAAMIEMQNRSTALARDIQARGGVDSLSPEQVAYSINQFVDAQRIAAIAKGAGSTTARALNARKVKFTQELASGITAANERKAAQKVRDQAARGVKRANQVLNTVRDLERERDALLARLRGRENIPPETPAAAAPEGPTIQEGMPGTPEPTPRAAGERPTRTPKATIDQIADAYEQLDRYNAMTLHEKEADFKRLQAEREARAAKRQEVVRGDPEELLKALQDELKWERGNFAKRKDTWETMAFWDTKANENVIDKRRAFRGGLYIEQQRRAAQQALKQADTDAARAFDAEMRRRTNQSDKARRMLESIGGVEVTKNLLNEFVNAINDPDPYVAAKFIQGTMKPSNWARAGIIRIAGLVSSPITHMVNVGGNAAGIIVEGGTRALVVPIDAIRAKVTGGERQAYMGELLPMMHQYGPGFLAQWGEARRILETGMSTRDITDLKRVRPGFASGSAGVDAAVEMPLRALKAEDALFRGGAFSAHAMRLATREAIREGFSGPQVQGRAASIMKNLIDYPDLAEEAERAAARMVFQERRPMPLGGGLGNEPEAVRFLRQQPLPFVQTPYNITAQGAALSPFGAIGTARSALQARGMPAGSTASSAERTAQGRATLEAEERLARTMIGTAIFGGALAMGGAGLLTAAYPTDQKEASSLPQGWRPWSMRIQDPVTNNVNYVPLQNLGPAGFPMAMAAILTDPQHRGKSLMDPDEQLNAATAIGRYVIDNTFLQGISDMVDMLHDPKQGASKFFEPLAASYGPYSSLAREIQRVQGVATRNPHEGLIGLVEALEANYPGLSGNVPPSLTPMGEERTQGATGVGRLVPFRYDIERDEPTLRTLREAGVGIPTETKTVNVGRGWSVDLTEDERAQLQRARGAAIRDEVQALERSRVWSRIPAGEAGRGDRNRLLAQAVSNAAQNTNYDWIKTLPDAELQRRAKQREVPDPYILGTGAA